MVTASTASDLLATCLPPCTSASEQGSVGQGNVRASSNFPVNSNQRKKGFRTSVKSSSVSASFLTGCTLPSALVAASVSRKSRLGRVGVRAAVATEAPPTTQAGATTFPLQGGGTLEISTAGATEAQRAYVQLRVRDSELTKAQLVAHWGAVKVGESKWTLPGLLPDGTKNYKQRALQSPFQKVGNELVLRIEVAEKYSSIEFTLKDEATNRWFKNNDGNYTAAIPASTVKLDPAKIVIPPEILSVQAYLNWEKNGRQNYSPDQERAEFEKGKLELQTQVADGIVTIDELRRQLLGGGGSPPPEPAPPAPVQEQKQEEDVHVPEDLVGIQAYIRWERNGKQNYSPEQQQHEYEEGRKELQAEVRNGASIEEIRKRLTGGSSATAPPPPPPRAANLPPPAHFNRKNRDYTSLINNRSGQSSSGEVQLPPPREPTAIEKIADAVPIEQVLSKKFYKFGNDRVLVLATAAEDGSDVKVTLFSTIEQLLTAHWGVAKAKGYEWLKVQQTPFVAGYQGDSSIQYLELPLGADIAEYAGVPFVLQAGGSWYKDMGADFWVPTQKQTAKPTKDAGDGSGTAKALLDTIADNETEAQRSLMHRYNVGTGIVEQASTQGELGLAAVLVWFRFMATRQLIWNKNYNVKPREISAAQDTMTDRLKDIYVDQPQHREIVRMILMTVGRGGEGDVGQRIRDEILVIQRANDCKGGMMEEWHQKLHNNTSPDDVVICQALLDYLYSNFDIDVYWQTLNSNGVTKERMRSYDRQICSEPKFRQDQKDGLIRDLKNYMKSLKAVHSGADLESAVAKCMGYSQGAMEDFMKSVEIHPIGGLSNDLPGLLQFVLEHVEDKQVVPLLQAILDARQELRPTLLKPHDRLKDIIFLDLSLDSTLRTAIERGMEYLSQDPAEIMYVVSLVVENLCLSSDINEELVYCLKDWLTVIDACKRGEDQWALRAKAVLDRTRLALADKAEHYHKILQPSAEYLGAKLNVEEWAISIFTEEMVRAGSAASLSLLLNRLDPVLRGAADMGNWQVISPVEVKGFVEVVDELGTVQDKVYTRPTILVAGRVRGEEEIPDGAVAVLTPDMPDILSHVSVRARNGKTCFATCFDPNVLDDLRSKNNKALSLTPTLNDLKYTEISESDVAGSNGAAASAESDIPEGLSIKKKTFGGKYAVVADEFTPELVGAKSRNIAGLRGALPDWVKLPTSVALPFGTFEKVLADPLNTEVATEIAALEEELAGGNFSHLETIRKTVLKLKAPDQLVAELKTAMQKSNMPFPGDEGPERWQQAWKAITRVWASKWNERAYFSTRKAKMNHGDLCMAVLVQEIVQADYAFVIHTTNPSTEDPTEIYAEVVKGLGETLVGAYSGRALSFATKKTNLDSPKVLGYPSKRVGLFIKQSVIFRSDSNGEDLEGYAGAGLYDSVPMDKEEERVVDYSSDQLLLDANFQKNMLKQIAKAGSEIEQYLNSPQDIEGVVKDGELYVVQTRPQM
eukprot:TRINITY_DN26421_c0_g1_i1.p1 TRINITY_DN26421_c0_g1~~TRINITY_DN26421_c0_g1_i1.p1  ORF type:complete len:1482 (-),score=381.52 TRINITY_DN26421_c0_g1_i1:676-5121(-)